MTRQVVIYLALSVLAMACTVGAYFVGVGVGQTRAAEERLVSRLEAAYLLQTLDFAIKGQRAIVRAEAAKASEAMLLQIADAVRFLSKTVVGQNNDTGIQSAVCARGADLEKLVGELGSSGQIGRLDDHNSTYVRTTITDGAKVFRSVCS